MKRTVTATLVTMAALVGGLPTVSYAGVAPVPCLTAAIAPSTITTGSTFTVTGGDVAANSTVTARLEVASGEFDEQSATADYEGDYDLSLTAPDVAGMYPLSVTGTCPAGAANPTATQNLVVAVTEGAPPVIVRPPGAKPAKPAVLVLSVLCIRAIFVLDSGRGGVPTEFQISRSTYVDGQWGDWQNSDVAAPLWFIFVPEGRTRFRVRAQNENGVSRWTKVREFDVDTPKCWRDLLSSFTPRG